MSEKEHQESTSYYEWEQSFKKKKLDPEIKIKDSTLGIAKEQFKDIVNNWKTKNLREYYKMSASKDLEFEAKSHEIPCTFQTDGIEERCIIKNSKCKKTCNCGYEPII